MSSASRVVAAVLLVALVTVEVGGGSLLAMLTRRMPGYLDNPLRQNLFRAMHAHAGVWVVLALIGMLYVDHAQLSSGLQMLVRATLFAAPVLFALGFPCRWCRPGRSGRTHWSGWSTSAGCRWRSGW
jgi:hypothetical protein